MRAAATCTYMYVHVHGYPVLPTNSYCTDSSLVNTTQFYLCCNIVHAQYIVSFLKSSKVVCRQSCQITAVLTNQGVVSFYITNNNLWSVL